MGNRESGILLHITSLYSKYGIGDLGQHAYEFVDFLKEGGQKLWQILPVNPTGFKDSPYQSFSTFAGNPLLICPEELVKLDLLGEDDLMYDSSFPKDRVDYGAVIQFKSALTRKAYHRFSELDEPLLKEAYNEFVCNNKSWLEDYALFMALKFHFINERSESENVQDYAKFARHNKDYLTKEQLADYYYGAVWQVGQ